jgi:MFS family permease
MTTSTDERATYREVFAVPEFRVLFTGYGIFLIGETVQMLALSVLIYAATGSPLLAALAYVAGFLPHAIGGTFLLSIADRWRPRMLMVAYDLVRLGVAIVLAVGVLSPRAMIALVFAVGTFAPAATAARTALLPELLTGDAYVLGRSVFTATAGATQVLGFGLGGFLLSSVGPYGALWLAAGACAMRAMVTRFGLPDWPARVAGISGAVRQTWRVNRQLLADRNLRGLILAQLLPGGLLVGAEGVIVPYTAGLGVPASAGVLFMSAAAGMLAGDLVVARLIDPARRERLTPWLSALLGIPPLVFLLRPGIVASAVLFAVATAGFSYHLGLARRFVDAVPQATRGQAFGLVTTGMMTVQGAAVAVAGGLAELLPPGMVMAIAGGASLLATAALFPQLRGTGLAGGSS